MLQCKAFYCFEKLKRKLKYWGKVQYRYYRYPHERVVINRVMELVEEYGEMFGDSQHLGWRSVWNRSVTGRTREETSTVERAGSYARQSTAQCYKADFVYLSHDFMENDYLYMLCVE